MKDLQSNIAEFIVKRRRSLLFAGFLILSCLIALIKIPKIDGRLTGFNIEETSYYKDGEVISGKLELTDFVQIDLAPKTTLTVGEIIKSLNKLDKKLTSQFDSIRIESLHSAPSLLGINTRSPEKFGDFVDRAENIPVLKQLISNDQKSFLVIVWVDGVELGAIDKFNSSVKSVTADQFESRIVSSFHVQNEIAKAIERDMKVLTLAILITFLIIVLFAYRSLTAIIFIGIIIGISILPVFSFLTLFDAPLNLITVLTIPIILVLSLSDAIHILTGYQTADPDDYDQSLRAILNKYLVPSFLTSLTTSIAFLSFMFNSAENIRIFGVITSITVMISFFLTYLVGCALLPKVKLKKRTNLIGKTSAHLFKWKKQYSGALVIISIIAMILLPKIKFNTDLDAFIPRNTELRDDQQAMIQKYHSLLRIELMIEHKSESAKMSEVKKDLELLVGRIEEIKGVGSVSSFLDHLQFSSRFGPYSRIANNQHSNPYVSKDRKSYLLDIRVISPNHLKEVDRKIRQILASDFKDYNHYHFSNGLVIDEINQSSASALFRSMSVSFVLIVLLFVLLTKSFKIAILSLIADLIPLSFLIVLFVTFKIEIDLLTALTAIVCLGLIVDDTVHVLYRKLILRDGMKELSQGVLLTTLLLIVGFSSFALSSFVPSQIFGVSCAVIFFMAVISDLTLLPYLIDKFWKPKKNGSTPDKK